MPMLVCSILITCVLKFQHFPATYIYVICNINAEDDYNTDYEDNYNGDHNILTVFLKKTNKQTNELNIYRNSLTHLWFNIGNIAAVFSVAVLV